MNKYLIAAIVTAWALSGACAWADEGWGTDFENAKKQASDSKKPIIAVFMGSDWCPWCMKLDKEILSQEEFTKYARDNMVRFLADFPRKQKQPEELSKQNKSLAEKYEIEGFPTVLLLNADGKEIARTGYRQGGAAKYMEHIKTLIKAKEQKTEKK